MSKTYKEGQGVLVRRVAFVTLAVLIFWGGKQVYTWLSTFEFARNNRMLNEYRLPVLDEYIDPAFFISWAVTIGGCVLLYRFLNRERAAEFLIETDSEVSKVTWPTWRDAFNSSLVVMLFVVVMTTYILSCDFVLTRTIKFVLQVGK